MCPKFLSATENDKSKSKNVIKTVLNQNQIKKFLIIKLLFKFYLYFYMSIFMENYYNCFN